jgi:hypothetical protein
MRISREAEITPMMRHFKRNERGNLTLDWGFGWPNHDHKCVPECGMYCETEVLAVLHAAWKEQPPSRVAVNSPSKR